MFIAVLFSIVVQFLVGMLNKNLFEEEYYYYFTFSRTAYPMLFMLLMIAVQPALIEELGYRGLIMSQLSRILDSKQVIFISAFVFALIHLSIFSMLWIIPFAVFLGYVKEKENTIWYGVVIHFMFNATACVFEFYDLKLF
jgi:membrane protease YdiL (CAAX protease family)